MGVLRPGIPGLDTVLHPDWDAQAEWSARARNRGAASAVVTAAEQGAPHCIWSRSAAKRVFDLACVLCVLPMAMPIMVMVALAVRLTSRGPALFRQQRMGRGGQCFTILKFRTMPAACEGMPRAGLTTESNQRFTPIGPLLRRWKLDELPQLANILRGEMSLVGPRPKLPCYEAEHMPCRPGLTGFATLVFAREEQTMARLPGAEVEAYYQAVVKPFKYRLDIEYMERATFRSDLALILRSVFRRWENVALTMLPPWIPQQHGVTPSERWIVKKPAMQGPEQALREAAQ